jgi:hypothetical protein
VLDTHSPLVCLSIAPLYGLRYSPASCRLPPSDIQDKPPTVQVGHYGRPTVTILAIAACHDWEIESFDFNAAYLNGKLDDNKEIYMHPPPGYETDSDFVKRLHKALYGLKQAGQKWYDTLSRALADIGFSVSQADPGVFIAKISKEILILAVHVDDCVFTGSSVTLITEYKEKINSCYVFTDLGPINWLLGIRVTRD